MIRLIGAIIFFSVIFSGVMALLYLGVRRVWRIIQQARQEYRP